MPAQPTARGVLVSSQETIQTKLNPTTPRTSRILFSILILRPTHCCKTCPEITPFLILTSQGTRPLPRCCPWRKDARVSSRRGRVLGLLPIPAPGVVSGWRTSGVCLMVRSVQHLESPFSGGPTLSEPGSRAAIPVQLGGRGTVDSGC